MKTYKFKCPECSYDVLEEIRVNACTCSPLTTITEEDDSIELEYEKTETTDWGATDYYQCRECGHILQDKKGRRIDFRDNLVDGIGIYED